MIATVNPIESNPKDYRFPVIVINVPVAVAVGALVLSIVLTGLLGMMYFLWKQLQT